MITATIITFNEEENIEKIVKNLEDLVGEIIVVDSGSTDKTVELLKNTKAKVYYREFDNFANQRNWAMSKASGEWILSVDPDEEIPSELKSEIKKAIENKKVKGYLMPRRNFILGEEIRYSRWSPDKHIWLWKKDDGRWQGDVHEEVVVQGRVGDLKNSKIHHSHKTVKGFMEANNFYSTLLAKSMYKKGIKFSFMQMFWSSFFEFNIRYFYKWGFLDGFRGFILAYLMMIYQLMVWVKLWEMEQKK